MWLLSTWNVVGMTKELHLKFLFLLNSILNSYTWLVAITEDSAVLGRQMLMSDIHYQTKPFPKHKTRAKQK